MKELLPLATNNDVAMSFKARDERGQQTEFGLRLSSLRDRQYTLIPVPTLDELAAMPERIATLPPKVLAALYRQAARLEADLLAHLLALALERRDGGDRDEPDRLLTVAEAATLLSISKDSLYRNAEKFPFVVRLGRHVRFSAKGIALYLRQRRGR